MSQINNHFDWCIKDERRLVKIKPDIVLAKKHLAKSEYNFEVMRDLEKLKRFDWAINVGFYSIYHCFLAILAKLGYESKNQSCTITVLLKLIEEEKLDLKKDLVLQFDTFDSNKEVLQSTIRDMRENFTYGVKSEIKIDDLNRIKFIIKEVQKQSIKIILN